jgi:hypothetical protein
MKESLKPNAYKQSEGVARARGYPARGSLTACLL